MVLDILLCELLLHEPPTTRVLWQSNYTVHNYWRHLSPFVLQIDRGRKQNNARIKIFCLSFSVVLDVLRVINKIWDVIVFFWVRNLSTIRLFHCFSTRATSTRPRTHVRASTRTHTHARADTYFSWCQLKENTAEYDILLFSKRTQHYSSPIRITNTNDRLLGLRERETVLQAQRR